MKKNLLFVIDSLNCAGAEKSLITLLSLIDYSKYEIDIQLFGYGGVLEQFIPDQANLLKKLSYTEFAEMNFKEAILKAISKKNFKMLIGRIKYSTKIRLYKYSNPKKAKIFWKSISNCIEKNYKNYDVAISYAQGIPTFYVAEKIKAEKKYAWVNTSYRLGKEDIVFQKKFYDKFNKIITVSDSAKKIFLETFPYYKENTKIIYDINNPNLILDMVKTGESYEDNFEGIKILTIARLAKGKRIDRALEASILLKKEGINFRWYILGEGPLRNEIERFIKNNALENNFKLLGVKANPYKYISECDIYVQTSDFEGFGLAIAEARLLNKPVVTTRYDAVYNQMIHKKNGLVVDMNAEAVYKGILSLIKDNLLRKCIIDYLIKEKKGNVEEVEKFYKLININ